jgi:lipoprotein-anchoring transpeptidase ErfK/SrfK
VRRAGLALLFIVGFALAGGAAAAVRDDTTPVTTTPPPTTTAPPPTTTVAPEPQVLPTGVTIAGVDVGGMAPTEAFLALQSGFPQTVELKVASSTLVAKRSALGATDYLWNAVNKAKTVPVGTKLDVSTAVKGEAVRAYLQKLAKRFDRKPVDATLRLRGTKPVIAGDKTGFRLQSGPAAAALVAALKAHTTKPVTLPAKVLRPAVSAKSFGPVIVVHRGQNQLDLYKGAKPWRSFGVATGQKIYPTPLGKFQIVAMFKNPWWYPPASPWAAGEKPVPPGPGNPLGTRWMGISSPGVGIHGTPDAASIGYSASHGCIRMAIPNAEWLFDHVEVGTPVYIVAS